MMNFERLREGWQWKSFFGCLKRSGRKTKKDCSVQPDPFGRARSGQGSRQKKNPAIETGFFTSSRGLDDQHRIAVRVEFVFFPDRFLVGFFHEVMAAECRNHHHQC